MDFDDLFEDAVVESSEDAPLATDVQKEATSPSIQDRTEAKGPTDPVPSTELEPAKAQDFWF
jgi:hypothetical protein